MRFSATTLDSYRLYVDGIKPEAELLATIRRERRPPTWGMALGRAFGAVLEAPSQFAVPGGYAVGRFRFEADAMEPALATLGDRRGLFEVQAAKRYGAHSVVARVDYIDGLEGVEFKTRVGAYRPSRYAASYQWRFELDVFDAVSVSYRVFRLNRRLRLLGIEELPLYRYHRIGEDLQALVDAFAGYVTRQGLEAYCQERMEEEFKPRRLNLDELRETPFEDSPTRKRTRKSRAKEEDVELPLGTFALEPLAPVATVPTPTWSLRSAPAGRLRQPKLLF